MQAFQRCTTTGPKTWREFLAQARAAGMNDKTALMDVWRYQQRCEDWMNDTYHVSIDKEHEHGLGPDSEVWHLSFKRHDREPMNDWREMQEIKNLLCGRETEAVQVYPKESRLMDTSNQYHLFAFLKVDGQHFPTLPWGFHSGRVVTDDPKWGKAKQRPRS